jgi:uncharacterized protein YdbL (DUF1318 family)
MMSVQAMRWVLLPVLLAGCVTVNVYFPAAAAEQAADRIIREVYGEEGAKPGAVPPAGEEPGASPAGDGLGMRVLEFLVPAALAQQPDIDVSTPAINRLKASMAARHRQLEPFYGSGAVGMDNNGLITVRDAKAVPIRERNKVSQLVAAENADRNALYAEIARANGHPEWEADIRATFARRWVANAPRGWYFRDAAGNWKQR